MFTARNIDYEVVGRARGLAHGGIGIMPVSGLWLYAHEFWQLVLIQFIAGAVWSAYELAMFLAFFEAVPRDERTRKLLSELADQHKGEDPRAEMWSQV